MWSANIKQVTCSMTCVITNTHYEMSNIYVHIVCWLTNDSHFGRYEVVSHRWFNLHLSQTASIGEDVKKTEPYCPVGRNTDWFKHCGKQYGVSSKN